MHQVADRSHRSVGWLEHRRFAANWEICADPSRFGCRSRIKRNQRNRRSGAKAGADREVRRRAGKRGQLSAGGQRAFCGLLPRSEKLRQGFRIRRQTFCPGPRQFSKRAQYGARRSGKGGCGQTLLVWGKSRRDYPAVQGCARARRHPGRELGRTKDAHAGSQ